MSKGEERIIQLLKKSGYKFEREKHFTDLKKGRYRFDFYVVNSRPRPCIIEFQGEGHYQYIGKFYKTRAEFNQAKERDRRKISYCLTHGIPLFIVPYWELENLKSAEDIFKERFRARDKWKNDKDWIYFKNLTSRQ